MIEITEEDFSLDEMIKRARRRMQAHCHLSGYSQGRRHGDDGAGGLSGGSTGGAGSIRDEAMSRFRPEVGGDRAPHRSLAVGDNIVAIVCSAAHREEAFRVQIHH